MANTSRSVLNHAAMLEAGSREMHQASGRTPGYTTKLVTAAFEWDVVGSRSHTAEAIRNLEGHRLARLGHSVLSLATQRPNLYGQSRLITASGLNVEQATLLAAHGYGPGHRKSDTEDMPYRLTVAYGDMHIPSSIVPNDSLLGRKLIAGFMSLTLHDVVLSQARSIEAMSNDFDRMKLAMRTISQTHGREHMDGTVYYFNLGNYMAQIAGSELYVQGQDHQPDLDGFVSMNLYQATPAGWALSATLHAKPMTSDHPADVTAYELQHFGDDTEVRSLNATEMLCAISVIEQLSRQSSERCFATDPYLSRDRLTEQARLTDLEIDMLPETEVDLLPLHLMY